MSEDEKQLDENGNPIVENPSPNEPLIESAEDDEKKLLRQALAEQQELIRQQNSNLESVRSELANVSNRVTEATRPPEPSIDDRNKNYYDNPTGAVTEIVKKELAETIAPVVNDFKLFTMKQQYNEIKSSFKEHPNYKTIFPHIEKIVDALVNSGKVELGSLQAVVDNIIGKIYTGQLKLDGFNPFASNPDITPPHKRPTPPGAPNAEKKSVEDESQYTESVRMLAKRYGMTPKEYVELSKEGDMVVNISTKKKETV